MATQSTFQLEDGFYTIVKNTREVATLQSVHPGTDVVLLPPSVDHAPGQHWEVTRESNGNYTITNGGFYLSFEGEPKRGNRIRVYPEAREWSLYKAAEPDAYHVVVPGGPVDHGRELAFDVSPLKIYPPVTDLNYLNVADQKQAWEFRRV
ncbi:hypothetical protein BJV77DRAFT_1019274 [Russula vinacea]|nr:hypothetical protein BJV77DRAFT_1019274 [Russula vinacea]